VATYFFNLLKSVEVALAAVDLSDSAPDHGQLGSYSLGRKSDYPLKCL
jgi:hypothetical protein